MNPEKRSREVEGIEQTKRAANGKKEIGLYPRPFLCSTLGPTMGNIVGPSAHM